MTIYDFPYDWLNFTLKYKLLQNDVMLFVSKTNNKTIFFFAIPLIGFTEFFIRELDFLFSRRCISSSFDVFKLHEPMGWLFVELMFRFQITFTSFIFLCSFVLLLLTSFVVQTFLSCGFKTLKLFFFLICATFDNGN
jgi:hypothetical protein